LTPALTPFARLTVTIARPLVIGRAEAGLREVIPITGGTVSGEIAGEVVQGGADRCLTRPDGVAEVWARYTLALDTGDLVSVLNTGLAFPQENGSYAGRTVPQFEVANGPLHWLRNHIFVGTLLAPPEGDRVELQFFRVD